MKTNLDLHFSAATAAMHTLEVTNEFDAEAAAMDIFKREGQDKVDWAFWRNEFFSRRNVYRQLKVQTPQSVVNAQRAQARIALKPAPPVQPTTPVVGSAPPPPPATQNSKS